MPLSGARPTTVLVVNGEIYNYRELRRELERAGHSFRTASDSEVAAHAYDRWGDAFLDRLDGMFALALWDEARQRLLLARDRLGEKSLFYTERVGILIFASELSALLAHPSVPAVLDPVALTQYLALEYGRPPAALFTACTSSSRVAPWPGSGANCDPALLVARTAPEQSIAIPGGGGRAARAPGHLRARAAMSDVPLGISLSGGRVQHHGCPGSSPRCARHVLHRFR